MNILSAFRPKGPEGRSRSPEVSQAEKVEVVERVEGSLGDLEADRKEVDGYNLALDAVLAGGLKSVAQLRAL